MKAKGRHCAASARRAQPLRLVGVAAVALLGGLAVAAPIAGSLLAGAQSPAAPHLEICKNGAVAGNYKFSVDGGANISVPANLQCIGVNVTAGNHTVTEKPDNSGATFLQKIKVIPGTQQVSQSINPGGAGGSVTVTVAATGTNSVVETKFFNEPSKGELKVCKVAGDPAQAGRDFTFSAQAGGNLYGPMTIPAAAVNDTYGSCWDVGSFQVGTAVNISEAPTQNVAVTAIDVLNGTLSNANYGAGTVTATLTGGVTEVSYQNTTVTPTLNGVLEICKNAGDYFVPQGPWSFTVVSTLSGQVVDTENVLTGQCNENPNGLPPGQYVVTESVGYPYYVSEISAYPSNTLVASNVDNASGTFTVTAGNSTTAFFTNDTLTGYVKACKTLASNASALAGKTFNFDVSDAAGTQTVSVIAQVGQTACSIDYQALPAGSTATITEESAPNVAVTGVSIVPPSAGSVSGTTASVTVSPTNINAANFTNSALGWVEICKVAGDASVSGNFWFSVNGAPSIPVAVGGCSNPIQVPAGTATISESPSTNYSVSQITAVGYAGNPVGNRLVWSSLGAGAATVTVPYGGVGDETVVTYTNSTNTGLFKVCTAETSSDAMLNGDTFPYTWSYTVNGVTTTGTVPLVVNVNQPTCSGLIGPIPVINANGTPVMVTVTAGVPTGLIGVDLAAFAYAGNGSVVTTPTTPGNFPQTAVIDLGQGINTTTFTNGATH